MTRRIFLARFADGHTEQRASTTRVYTHAYRFTHLDKLGKRIGRVGFSQSAEQASRNQAAESAWLSRQAGADLKLLPIVATEELA